MNRKKTLKLALIFLVILVVAGAVYGSYWLYQKYQTKQVVDNKAGLVARMTSFDVKDKTIDQGTIDRYYEAFNKNKDFFLNHQDNLEAFQTLVNMGLFKQLVGDYTGAEEIWLYTYKLEPNSYLLNGNLAHLYQYYLKDYPKAEEFYLKALESKDIASANQYTYFSELYDLYHLNLNDQVKAVETLDKAIKALPSDINVYLMAARHYKEAGDYAKARDYYNQALKINPNSLAAKEGLKNLNQ